ncbi:MAG: muconate cycloisomerase [Armatimonadetes bacterium]|nr:muconate cycloisomerase [Armatimonadota bacterium]
MSLIKRVEVLPCRVPFRQSFVIGRGQVGTAGDGGRHVFVRIETEDGHVGWGEARALPVWSYETVESIATAVRNYLGPLLIGRSPFELNAIHRAMYETLTPAVSNGQPFAKSAVDIALHDLQGKLTGQPIHALLGGKVRSEVPLTYALSIAEPGEMARQAAGYAECGCFKIKVAGDPEADAERVRAISQARPDAMLWLDANQAYHPAVLVPFLHAIREVPRIFCLEQPVRSVDWLGLRQARERSHLPIAIDEGCFSSFDMARVAELRAADLVVLKVCKSGGLRECLKSATVADAHGIGLLGSGLTESGIGFVASIHYFSTLQTLLPPELNGVQFLESMWVEGLRIDGSTVTVPDGPGLGITVDEAAIRRHVVTI